MMSLLCEYAVNTPLTLVKDNIDVKIVQSQASPIYAICGSVLSRGKCIPHSQLPVPHFSYRPLEFVHQSLIKVAAMTSTDKACQMRTPHHHNLIAVLNFDDKLTVYR